MKKYKTYDIIDSKAVFIWSLFFIINAVVAIQLKVLTIIPDELNPLGVPAYLSGLDWSTSISNYKNYYGYGQAILYTPLFYLINDNILLYKAIILVNSFIVSFIPVVAYKILKEHFDMKNDKITLLIACVVGAQPCYLTLSKRAWNESLVMLLLWIVCYLILKCYKTYNNKKYNCINSILLAIALMYGYATHGRFIAVIAAVIIIVFLYIIAFRKKVISLIPFTITFLFLYYVNKLIEGYFLKKVWLVNSESELRNTFAETFHRAIENIFSIDTLYVYLRAFSGYIFYLLIASLGLLVLGVIVYCKVIKVYLQHNKGLCNGIENDNIIFFGAFCICLVICAIGVAIIFFTTDLKDASGYYYIYGRYTEYLLGPAIMITLKLIIKYGVTMTDLAISSLILVAHYLYTFIIEAIDITNPEKTVVSLNIFTLESFSYNYGIEKSKLSFITAILVALICFIIIVLLLNRKKYICSFGFILFVFIISYAHTANSVLIPDSQGMYQSLQSSYHFFNNIKLDNKNKTIYLYNIFPHNYQLALKDFKFQPIYDENFILEKGTFIIVNGTKDYKFGCDYHELYKVKLDYDLNDEKIFVYGNNLAQKLKEEGVKLNGFTYILGDVVNYSNNNNSNNYLNRGWSVQENWGIWSEGNDSGLYFPLNEQPKKDININLKVSAFNSEKNVEMYVNGDYLSTLCFTTGVNNYEVKVPLDMIAGATSLDLVFKITDKLVSPQEIGMSADTRKLGFGLYSIKIY
ncbi:hypothetical protein SAMN02745136_03064 [Anaerocolumna jejuensis DSM 15929]|uniref:Glycosyltransferase RgtA/B/C/D-like domain-containing protein n=1 Tax=Anaerocolumna jejuensis DSM 15929 TaxID=1121322 RepID=A0A1M6UFJ5_9FIRM|nr:hypothetical protein [Anaerocolumna jejuensis]SHK67956.1 hypothetical protein SAMN02745136_03064 [Anaerocolumna jejuensis DSM 15929]